MSPILVRPVREQLEHDRVIRLLQAKYKRKFEVSINPGNEQSVPVSTGASAWYPDLVLQSSDRGRRLLGVVEVETAESVNNLEAMSQWSALSKAKAPFHLYVPSGSVDTARRLCADFHIPVAEVWAYHWLGDQMRFTLVHRAAENGKSSGAAVARTTSGTAARRGGAAKAARPPRATAARPVRRTATAAGSRKPAAKKRVAGAASGRRASGTKTVSRPARKAAARAQRRK